MERSFSGHMVSSNEIVQQKSREQKLNREECKMVGATNPKMPIMVKHNAVSPKFTK